MSRNSLLEGTPCFPFGDQNARFSLFVKEEFFWSITAKSKKIYFENKLSAKVVLKKMAYTTNAAEYLREGGATNNDIDFSDFCSTFKDGGKKARYEVYRLWARLLRHQRT